MTNVPRVAFAGHGGRPVRAIPRHSHAAPILIWYTRGRGRLTWDGGVVPFTRRTLVCVPAGLPYAEDSVAGFMSLYIAIAGLRLERLEALGTVDDARFAAAARLVLEEVRAGDVEGCAEALPSLLRALRRLRSPRRDVLIDAALELIHAQAGDPAFTIRRAAARLGVPLRRLRARFVATVGMSPLRYLTSRRVDEAKRLLAAGGFPVRSVAERVGFADPYYFSRAFRRVAGVSPQAWRESQGR